MPALAHSLHYLGFILWILLRDGEAMTARRKMALERRLSDLCPHGRGPAPFFRDCRQGFSIVGFFFVVTVIVESPHAPNADSERCLRLVATCRVAP